MSGTQRHRSARGEVRRFPAADGARLEYEVLGNGPPLVMLHGVLAGRRTFSRQHDGFADHRRLIMPSARGHDGSEGRLPPNYSVGDSDVDDLLALLDAEGLGTVDLFGHSSGGATAFVFACRYPARVRRLVLAEPSLLALLPPEVGDAVVAGSLAVAAAGDSDGPGVALRTALAFTGGDAWQALDREAQERRLQAMASCAAVVGPHFRGLCALDVGDADVIGLGPPTLLLYGENSFPFEAVIGERFRALRPDLPFLIVAGAGHNVHRDRADFVNAEVAAFLAGG
ncbi:MAG TPA: alpha/beta hydrolase [Acetobacteraceae bacterium]|nr:alpha/beta hydrolase [Acetobacteraceae bacterium]